MSNLTRLFTIGQIVRCRMDKKFYKGIVKETYPDHIVVDIPEIRNIAGSKTTSIWIVCIRNVIFKNNKNIEK